MSKEVIISTSRLNHYGTRILTEGIDLEQYRKNPILLWMHNRPFGSDSPLPIGRMENLRIDGDKLIGTPVFDTSDEFAKKISDKWENGFLKMVSGGFQVLELSDDPSLLVIGQTRKTITRCRLEEVSIVDIGANDDALQLTSKDGKRITLSKDEDCDMLPLISNNTQTNNNTDNMNKELLELLGLPKDSDINAVLSAVRALKAESDKGQEILLSAVNTLVDTAIKDKRVDASKKEHFVNIGKQMGLDALNATLSVIPSPKKISDTIHNSNPTGNTYERLSQVPEDELRAMRENDRDEYIRLFKAEYGFTPTFDKN